MLASICTYLYTELALVIALIIHMARTVSADGGMNDLAYEVLTTPSYPGYRWMMDNAVDNATTIWEAWFFSDNTFSHNHPMFASSEVWLMQSVAGIQPHPAAKGFDKVRH